MKIVMYLFKSGFVELFPLERKTEGMGWEANKKRRAVHTRILWDFLFYFISSMLMGICII